MRKVVLSSNLNTTLELVTYPWTLGNVSNRLYLRGSKISSTTTDSNIDSKLFLYSLEDIQVILNLNGLRAVLISRIPTDITPQQLFEHLSTIEQEVSAIHLLLSLAEERDREPGSQEH